MSDRATAFSKAFRARAKGIRDTLRLLRRNPLALIGLAIALGLLVVAILAPVLAPPAPGDPYQRPRTWLQPQPPGTPAHLLGTGVNGADIYYGLVWGTRVSLQISLYVVGAAVLIGLLLGGIAGYFGRWVDEAIMRITDLFIAIPGLILAMAVASALGRSIQNIMIALIIVWWPAYVRIFRSQVLVTKQSQYIEAAKCSGASSWRILLRHIVPNSIAPLLVQASLDLGVVILVAAGLSFIGFGASPGYSEWGLMIAEGRDYIAQGFWWMVVFPGLAISIFVLGFNLLGDGLRDLLDPKLRSLMYGEITA
jgi:peptide/nickel transport system permease protein